MSIFTLQIKEEVGKTADLSHDEYGGNPSRNRTIATLSEVSHIESDDDSDAIEARAEHGPTHGPTHGTQRDAIYVTKTRRVTRPCYVCNFCTKSCRTKLSLKNHLRRHRNQPLLSVAEGVVEAEEGNSTDLASELDLEGEPTKKQFQCPHCAKVLKSRGCLDSHMKGIHGEKKFQCGHCGLKYGLQAQLNVHVARDHEGRS